MPLSFQIDQARKIVVITGDYADASAWRVLLERIAQDPLFSRGFSFIRDLRGSDNPVTPETVMGIIEVVRKFWDTLGVRRAAIVTHRAIDDPAMVAEALAADARLALRAFTSYEDAVRWLTER